MKTTLVAAMYLLFVAFAGPSMAQNTPQPSPNTTPAPTKPLPALDAESAKVMAPLSVKINGVRSQIASLASQMRDLQKQLNDLGKDWTKAQVHAIDLANQQGADLDPRFVVVDLQTASKFIQNHAPQQ